MNEPLLSIYCITYNHRNYIVGAIESFLMQKTTFSFKIVIGEDCSTDGTKEIVLEYAKKYPDIIRVITSKKNVGAINNSIRTLNACKGKYIAICEGDDYWTDPLKLQKQVDFLEENPDYSLCFHNTLILYDDKSHPPRYFCSKYQKKVSIVEDVIKKWFIPSASMVIRKNMLELPSWFNKVYNGDWTLHLLLSLKGKIGYLDEVMSVYRKSLNPCSLSNVYKGKAFIINQEQIKILQFYNEYTEFRYNELIQNKIIILRKLIRRGKLKISNPILYYITNPLNILHFIKSFIYKKYFNN